MTAPTGDIALVFTDIQGSTRLWEAAPDATARALDLHNAALRQVLGEAGGYEVKNEGDAFLLAFQDADDALGWCAEGQRCLMALPWPAELLQLPDARTAAGIRGLRVRMGLHVGHPLRRADPVTGRIDYLGPPVNRTARVAAAGHGGQVLLSGRAVDRITRPPPGVRLEPLGDYLLRGVPEPISLYEARLERLRRGPFPAVRASRIRRGNLPDSLPPILGRDAALVELEALVRPGHLVTLLGPGGTGKTRLSLGLGERLLPRAPGGVWFFDLSDAHSVQAMCTAVAAAMGVRLAGGDPVEDLAGVFARRGEALFILDNLEQLAEVAAMPVARWVAASPQARWLASSRIPLGVAVERRFHVMPLALPPAGEDDPARVAQSPAVALFVQHARRRRPDFAVTGANAEAIAEIVRRLDGLPLALELAAARAGVLPPAALLARLDQQFKLLTDRSGGRPARHATLRATIDWSWQLLRPWEQAALARCAVFEGGFLPDAAEAIVDLDPWPEAPFVLDVLQDLVERSVLRVVDPETGRLGMMVSVQAFAREQLAARGDQAEAEARHLAWFAALAEPDALSLHPELDNLVAAARRGLRDGDPALTLEAGLGALSVLRRRGPLSAALELAEDLRDLDGPPGRMAWLEVVYATLVRNSGDYARVDGILDDALAMAEACGDLKAQAFALLQAGVLHHDRAAMDDARTHYERAIALARRCGAHGLRARALTCLAHVYRELGDAGTAREHFEAGRRAARRTGDDAVIGMNVGNYALLHIDQGRPEQAIPLLEEALGLSQRTGDRLSEAVHLLNLSSCHLELGQLTEARELVELSTALFQEAGNSRLYAGSRSVLGAVLLEQGALTEARGNLAEALDIQHDIGARDAEGATLAALGELTVLEGDPAGGFALLERSADLLASVDNRFELARSLARQARARMELGQLDEARVVVERLGPLAEALDIAPGSWLGRLVEMLRSLAIA
ncbi:MAG: tetratricopeptide repeat protein [Alphaproteobacteria bacterium]|nr:tetratricopeptide repeat protein [Alphaproteobacteria bacterium]